MTNDELLALEQLAAKATKGPWCAEGGSLTDWQDGYDSFSMELIDNRRVSREQRDADLSFMAAARTAVPELIAEARRLQAALKTIQETASDAIRREGREARGGGDYWQIEADARAALGMPKEEDE